MCLVYYYDYYKQFPVGSCPDPSPLKLRAKRAGRRRRIGRGLHRIREYCKYLGERERERENFYA